MKYSEAGVDLERAAESVRRIRNVLQRLDQNQANNIGRFGGMFLLPNLQGYRRPYLVASVDGVGTKTMVAALANRWEVCGYDIIAHGINDILVQGAHPLFALDYIGTGRLVPERIEQIVKGMVECCGEHGVQLIGGETAEMPDVYAPSDVDVVGTVVGLVDEEKIINPDNLQPGDVLIGLPSTGLHTNGFSLARRIFFDELNWSVDTIVDEYGRNLGDILLTRHRCYLKTVKPLLDQGWVKALVHITGGGLTDNIPRVLNPRVDALIRWGTWPVPPIFHLLQVHGNVDPMEMRRTFNMGVGMVLMATEEDGSRILSHLSQHNETSWIIGNLIKGEGRVRYEGP